MDRIIPRSAIRVELSYIKVADNNPDFLSVPVFIRDSNRDTHKNHEAQNQDPSYHRIITIDDSLCARKRPGHGTLLAAGERCEVRFSGLPCSLRGRLSRSRIHSHG